MPRPVALTPWTSDWAVRAEADLQAAAPGAFRTHGVTGRRYFTRDDPETGVRDVHLHVHAAGDPMIAWHLAFRDRLRAEPATAAAYEREKLRCAALHPDDSGAYAACKKAWTDGAAAEAMRRA